METLRAMRAKVLAVGGVPEAWEMTAPTLDALRAQLTGDVDAVEVEPGDYYEVLGLPVHVCDVLHDPYGAALAVRLVSERGIR